MQTHDRLKIEGVCHGFFGRKGGVSSGIYGHLNCGLGSDDDREKVLLNRTRLLETVSPNKKRELVTPHQIHSAECLVVERPWTAGAAKVDALVTAKSGIILAVATADCGPVLFCDREVGVVGAAHAGWKGAVTGVLDATVDQMINLGAKAQRIVAILGPTISQRAYEVQSDFRDRFIRAEPECDRFFVQGKDHEHYQFDLPSYIIWRLSRLGVGYADWTGQCTYELEDDYFSYRRSTHRDEKDYGRQLAAIGIS